jgi:hypothetical protein
MKKYFLISLIAIFGFGFIIPMFSSASPFIDIKCSGATDDSAKIVCLQSRVDNLMSQIVDLGNRITALESKAIPNGAKIQVCPAGCICSGNGPDGTISCPAKPIDGGQTKICPANCTCSGDAVSCPTVNTSGGQTANTGGGTAPTSTSSGFTIQVSPTETKAIQGFLREEGSFNYPTATGNYGSITKDAVRKFQTKQGLPATGIIDQATLEKMKALAPSVAPSASASLQQVK